MDVYLIRTYKEKETLGNFIIIGGSGEIVFQCKTIELPWKNNARQISCIPAGTYQVEKTISPTKGKCFHVKDVPSRDSILIHIGNYASGKKVDTLGCILPGMGFVDLNKDGELDVTQSTNAMISLLNKLPDSFTLKII